MIADLDAAQKKNQPSETVENVSLETSDQAPLGQLRNEDISSDEDAIEANPQWGSVTMLSMAAAFDTAVPEAVVNANYNLFRARELHDPLAGMTDGSGSLRNFFLFMQGLVDENGNPRTEDGNDDDGRSDYIDAANEREERRDEMRRDVEATLSEAQIDAVAWVGDADEAWSFDGKSASRRQWLAGAKAARAKIEEKVASGEIFEEQGAHEMRLVSENELAIKEHRYADAARSREQMQPWSRDVIDQNTHTTVSIDHSVAADTSHAATSAASTMVTSTAARDDALAQIASADRLFADRLPLSATSTARESGLSNPPSVEPTEDFNVAAAPLSAPIEPMIKPVQVAYAQPVTQPPLDQGFSI